MQRWLAIVAIAGGCHKQSAPAPAPAPGPGPTAPASTAELDALWAKAPDGAMVGIVASPRAIGMAEHAWHDVHAFLKSLPDFAPAEQAMTEELAKHGLAPDFAFADLGLGPAKGGAFFAVDDGRGMIAIVPLVDRDKLLATLKGTKGADGDQLGGSPCKPIDGGYYACASDGALFARLGKGKLRASLDAAKARGDVELVVASPVAVAAVAQLERGTLVVRGTVTGVPAMYTDKLGAPGDAHVDLDHAAGFATLDIARLLGDVPPGPAFAGVSFTDLVRSIGGPLTITIASGAFAFDARVPLRTRPRRRP